MSRLYVNIDACRSLATDFGRSISNIQGAYDNLKKIRYNLDQRILDTNDIGARYDALLKRIEKIIPNMKGLQDFLTISATSAENADREAKGLFAELEKNTDPILYALVGTGANGTGAVNPKMGTDAPWWEQLVMTLVDLLLTDGAYSGAKTIAQIVDQPTKDFTSFLNSINDKVNVIESDIPSEDLIKRNIGMGIFNTVSGTITDALDFIQDPVGSIENIGQSAYSILLGSMKSGYTDIGSYLSNRIVNGAIDEYNNDNTGGKICKTTSVIAAIAMLLIPGTEAADGEKLAAGTEDIAKAERIVEDATKEADIAKMLAEARKRVAALDINKVTVPELKTAMDGFVDETIDTFMDKFGTSYKSNPLRIEYESKVNGLADMANMLRNEGKKPEEIARTVSQARRDLGVQYKGATPPILRDFIYDVNTQRYGDPLGPTFDSLMTKHKGNFEDIIRAASRPNSDVDSLLGGFKPWLTGKLQ